MSDSLFEDSKPVNDVLHVLRHELFKSRPKHAFIVMPDA
jgi:hypothetical protein